MPSFPDDIADLGPASQKPRLNPVFNPVDQKLTSEEYYVLTRIDGGTSLKDIVLMLGFGVDKGISLLQRLRKVGAFLFEGESPEDLQPAAPEPTPEPALELSAMEQEAMEEDNVLGSDERMRVLRVLRIVRTKTFFDLFKVDEDFKKRDLKRSYFRLSKEFHPDRYYGKRTGSFGPWLDEIFQTATNAFEVLSDARQREEYVALLRGTPRSGAPRSQTKSEHAAELFDRARHEEAHGNLQQAIMLYRAVVRMEPTARYLQRAARCLLQEAPEEAEVLAGKARQLTPEDPSCYRVHADALRALQRWSEAEEVLEAALRLKSENDALLGEIHADLERVRRALKSP